jgi:hypothetical protein
MYIGKGRGKRIMGRSSRMEGSRRSLLLIR